MRHRGIWFLAGCCAALVAGAGAVHAQSATHSTSDNGSAATGSRSSDRSTMDKDNKSYKAGPGGISTSHGPKTGSGSGDGPRA